MDISIDTKSRICEVMMDMLIKDFTKEDGALLSFNKLIDGVMLKFSNKITEEDIWATIDFIHENIPGTDFLIFAILVNVGSTPNVPYIKGELEPDGMNQIKTLFSKFNKLASDPQNTYFVKNISRQQMTFFTVALMKNLFPRPKKGQLLVEKSPSENESIFVFKAEYYDILCTSIDNAYKADSFVKSNSEIEWTDLRNAIKSAIGTNKFDIEKLIEHPLSE
jgi:hypothetical protein